MSLQQIKDLLTTLRESIIVCVFILLLFLPGCFNSILVDAGFTEGSVMGFTWKQKAIESSQLADSSQQLAQAAALQLEAMQAKLDSISKKLAEASTTTQSPQVDSIYYVIDASNKSFIKSNVQMKKKLYTQQLKLNDITKFIDEKR